MIDLAGTPEPLLPRTRPQAVLAWTPAPALACAALALGLGALPTAAGLALVAAMSWWWTHRARPKPIVVHADADALMVADPATREPLVLPLARVRAVRLHRLPTEAAVPAPSDVSGTTDARRADRHAYLLVIADRNGPVLTIRLTHEPDVVSGLAEVDDAALGELVGVSSPSVPPHALVRQVIDDPNAQLARHLAQRLAPRVPDRLALRTWSAPPQPGDVPTGWLELDGDSWSLHGMAGTEQGAMLLPRIQRADVPDSVRVELGTTFGTDATLTLCFAAPAIAAGMDAPPRTTSGARWLDPHEGALLLAHVITRGPESTWPAALRRRLGVVRGAGRVRATSARPPGKRAAGGPGAR